MDLSDCATYDDPYYCDNETCIARGQVCDFRYDCHNRQDESQTECGRFKYLLSTSILYKSALCDFSSVIFHFNPFAVIFYMDKNLSTSTSTSIGKQVARSLIET